MSAPTLGQIMTGIETRLATITGLRHSNYIADQVNPPHAVVAVPDISNYRETMGRGSVVFEFHVYLFISSAMDRAGQSSLASFVSWTGTNSIPLAIEGDRTLGGIVDDCVVDSFRNFGLDEVSAYHFYGGEFVGRVASPGV